MADKKVGSLVVDLLLKTASFFESTNKVRKHVKSSSTIFTEWNQALELTAKAFGLLKGSYNQLSKVMDNGNDVAEVSANFEKLQGTPLKAATSLEALRTATQGTVTDLDLMIAANQAAQLGIPTEAFIQGADAAVKLGEAVRKNASEALNDYTEAMAKGNDKALIAYGINIDLAEEQEKYANSIGVTSGELTEQQKILVNQEAINKKIIASSKGVAGGAGAAGQAFKEIDISIRNQINGIEKAIASNLALSGSFNDVSTAIKNVDEQPIIEALTNISNAAASTILNLIKFAESVSAVLTQAAREYAGVSSSFERFNIEINRDLDYRAGSKAGEIREQIESLRGLAEQQNLSAKQVELLKVLTAQLGVELAKTSGLTDEQKEAFADFQAAIALAAEESTVFKDEVAKTKKALEQQDKAVEKTTESQQKATKSVTAGAKAEKKLREEHEELVAVLQGKAIKALDVFKDKLKELHNLNPDADIYDLAASLEDYADAAVKAGNSTSNISSAIEDVAKDGGGFLDSLFKVDGDVDYGQAIGKSIYDGISGAIETALSGGNSEDYKAAAEDLGAGIGEALGASIGGPAGAVIGKIFGKEAFGSAFEIGEQVIKGSRASILRSVEDSFWGVGKYFLTVPTPFGPIPVSLIMKGLGFGKNAQSAARDAISDIFDEAILELNDNWGFALERFDSLGDHAFDSMVDSAGNATTMIDQELSGMSQDSRQKFNEIGLALEQVFDIPGLADGQLGKMLAYNFGMGKNSLNDLQLVLQSMNLTLEQTTAQLEDTFLRGNLSAGEFLVSLNATRDIFTQGIPGAIGDTSAALSNYKKDALSSGAAAKDALGDVAAEYEEYNKSIGDTSQKTLEDLKNYLVQTGQMTPEEAQQMFSAYAAAGINSIEDLKNITTEQTAIVTNNLEKQGYAFEKAAESADELKKKLDAIENKAIEIQIDVNANVDENAQTILDGMNNGLSSTSTTEDPETDPTKTRSRGILGGADFGASSRGYSFDAPKTTGRGAMVINIDARGAAPGVENAIASVLADMEGRILERSVEAVIRLSDRGVY